MATQVKQIRTATEWFAATRREARELAKQLNAGEETEDRWFRSTDISPKGEAPGWEVLMCEWR